MIVLDKVLEERFDALIKEHCDAQRNLGVPATVFLLIGSRIGDDLYVAHIAKCPLPETALDSVCDIFIARPSDRQCVSRVRVYRRNRKIRRGRRKPAVRKRRTKLSIPNGSRITGVRFCERCPEESTLSVRVYMLDRLDHCMLSGLMLFADKKALTQGTFRAILLRALKMLANASSTVSWMRLKPAETLMVLRAICSSHRRTPFFTGSDDFGSAAGQTDRRDRRLGQRQRRLPYKSRIPASSVGRRPSHSASRSASESAARFRHDQLLASLHGFDRRMGQKCTHGCFKPWESSNS